MLCVYSISQVIRRLLTSEKIFSTWNDTRKTPLYQLYVTTNIYENTNITYTAGRLGFDLYINPFHTPHFLYIFQNIYCLFWFSLSNAFYRIPLLINCKSIIVCNEIAIIWCILLFTIIYLFIPCMKLFLPWIQFYGDSFFITQRTS